VDYQKHVVDNQIAGWFAVHLSKTGSTMKKDEMKTKVRNAFADIFDDFSIDDGKDGPEGTGDSKYVGK